MLQYRVISKYIKNIANPQHIKHEYKPFIVMSDTTNPHIYQISSLSSYIYLVYGHSEYNTQLQAAKNICTFLNFLINNTKSNHSSDIKSNGLYALTIQDFADFINYLTYIKQDSYLTVKQYERRITRFYAFLSEIGILDKNLINIAPNPKNNKPHYVSPFDELNNKYLVHFPSKHKRKAGILKDMNEDMIALFINYARIYYPHIVLGIELECCGGLRGAELVNLKVDDITTYPTKNYMKTSIKDHQYSLFASRNISLQNSQVKKPRNGQVIFNFNGQLFDLWDAHMKYLEDNSRDKKNPLFVNADGYAMSGDSYRKQFDKLKFDFITFLEDNGYYENAEQLRSKKWSTHIGRHIYTNYLLKTGVLNDSFGKPNAEFLAVLRGDSSLESASTYIDESVLLENISKSLELLGQMALLNQS